CPYTTLFRSSQLGRCFPGGGDAAFLDAGAGADPFVAGVDQCCPVVVGHHTLGDVTTEPQDGCRGAHLPRVPVRTAAPYITLPPPPLGPAPPAGTLRCSRPDG